MSGRLPVVTTDRDDEETAAVLAVLAILGVRAETCPPLVRTVWADRTHQLRGTPAPGHHSWWTSGLHY